VLVAGVGVMLARRLDGRYAVALAIAWGLLWIAVGRATDEPRSSLTAWVAVAAAVVAVGSAVRVRRRGIEPL
jgi:hypothetical protein